jgi:Holliday junction DNA helicase RuvA
MFNSITGIITGKFPQNLFLTCNGIEWSFIVPDSSLDVFSPLGQEGKVYTWLYHREDTMKLFGFPSAKDRLLFIDLLKVDGVGPKGAIKIMSSISTNQLVEVLDSEDIARLEKIPGIGKKTAQKMMLTLKGKLSLDSADNIKNITSNNTVLSPWVDVVQALVNMGYDKRSSEEVIEKLLVEYTSPITETMTPETKTKVTEFSNKNRAGQEEILFRQAIIKLV